MRGFRWERSYSYWEPKLPVGARIANGKRAATELAAKEKRQPSPVVIEGRTIARSFWGQRWCQHLERFQDFSNRLPRGQTYVRNGSVVDLVIEPGLVRALVSGTETYTVRLEIKTLAKATWKSILNDCAQEIDSLFDLLQGQLNDGVMRRLVQAEEGLLPTRKQIEMTCSCPDYAQVCKHVAAVFYGVGARLDRQPELLFTLRNVDPAELVRQAARTENVAQALSAPGVALNNDELSAVFGIDLDDSPVPTAKSPASGLSPSRAKPRSRQPAASPARRLAEEPLPAATSRLTPTPELLRTFTQLLQKAITRAEKSPKGAALLQIRWPRERDGSD